MQFVRIQNLKIGMRLARPIYKKSGVLLFERNSLLTQQAIESVRNFGLLGIYILEPAEPLPPMTEEDLEFERFQIKSVSSIQEELTKILETKHQHRMQLINSAIIKKFGHLENKINFYQNLRSQEDYVYRHSLNVAILCAMITHVMNVRLDEQANTVSAAIIHDIGKLEFDSDSVYGEGASEREMFSLYSMQMHYSDLIEGAFAGTGSAIRRICMQALKAQMEILKDGGSGIANMKMVTGAKILLVANKYDEMTAMNLCGDAQSEVKAIQEFLDNPHIYDPAVVSALIRSVNILFPGVSVELNTGEKALVLVENPVNILRPVVLSFRDNSVLDLQLKNNEDIHIVDIMKTMDNRYIMDINTLQQLGYAQADREVT